MRSTKRSFTARLTATVLMLCLFLPLAADATNVEDSLIIGIQSTKTPLLRPLDPKERDIMSIYDMVYDGLVSIDDDYLPQPALAESWEESGGGKTWTFHLREGVTFSDGTPLTAHDVVATAQYILDRANNDATTEKGYYVNLKYFVSKISAAELNIYYLNAIIDSTSHDDMSVVYIKDFFSIGDLGNSQSLGHL